MGLNDIVLPAQTIASLYPDSLVAPERPAGRSATGNEIRFLGKNGRHICFLVAYDRETFLPDGPMETLTKILSACKMTMEDVAVVNSSNQPLHIDTLRDQLKPDKLIMLGVSPATIRLPIQFPEYRPQPYAGCTFLLADALDTMENPGEGRKLKMQLWNSLKELFEL